MKKYKFQPQDIKFIAILLILVFSASALTVKTLNTNTNKEINNQTIKEEQASKNLDSLYSTITVDKLNDSIIHQYVFEATNGNKKYADLTVKCIRFTTNNWKSNLINTHNNLTNRYNSYNEPIYYSNWTENLREFINTFLTHNRNINELKEVLFVNHYYPVDPITE